MSRNETDPISVPTDPRAPWVERWLWVFMLAFALDYRAAQAREGGSGAGLDQLLFLGLAGLSTLAITWLGRRYLLVRPGAWILIGWCSFLAFMLANAFLQGVLPGRSLRVILPLALGAAGILNAHIASCMGIRPSRIVAPILAAACINVIWRIAHGFLFKGVTLETARVEVQSSANNWLAAWIGACLILRRRFHPLLLVASAVLLTGVLVTVTRSLLFPIMASALASTFCFFLSSRWKVQPLRELPRRLIPVAGMSAFLVASLTIAAVTEPVLIERWTERLFHHASDRNTTVDISYTTRVAEAEAIFEILNRAPVAYLHGKGIGASYYWHPAYMQEIRLVFPPDSEVGNEVWFAGHSTWTYSLFSGGAIALFAHIALFVGTIVLSLKAARTNASHPGPDYWLAFLPLIATCCLLSETLTSNPFDERLASIIYGMMVGLPQAFLVRASWIHTRTSRTPS